MTRAILAIAFAALSTATLADIDPDSERENKKTGLLSEVDIYTNAKTGDKAYAILTKAIVSVPDSDRYPTE